jgi:hypothetical protein
MENITFCIPYYGKEEKHTAVLKKCIDHIIKIYPNNQIIICKTSDSYILDLEMYQNIKIFNTFKDGSHIIGAIELLIRECKTSHFIICHDSMFLLRPLPIDILFEKYYSLWYFEKYRSFDNLVHEYLIKDTVIDSKYHDHLIHIYHNFFRKKWFGVFGASFGGKTEILNEIWNVLNITPENIDKYIGRYGLKVFERYLGIIIYYIGYDTLYSLNGSIFDHPNPFWLTIEDIDKNNYNTHNYQGYFIKSWQARN